jgi:hypothetical protein
MAKSEANLIKQFIQSWEMLEDEPHPVSKKSGELDLQLLDTFLPMELPPLFIELLTNFHWEEVYFEKFRLLPNQGIKEFITEVSSDKFLSKVLLSNGLIQFARAVDGASYDLICFDTRGSGKQYPIVRVDHEEALIRDKLKVLSVVAPSFDALLLSVISNTASDN